jgi:hypothetical protein
MSDLTLIDLTKVSLKLNFDEIDVALFVVTGGVGFLISALTRP